MAHLAEAIMPPSEEHVREHAVDTNHIHAALERVLCAQALEHSPQLQRLLRFLVEETLAGRGSRLKEFVIGVEVFGRPANYDPRLDSLVRVEARRLRSALESYYAFDGQADPVRIVIPKGSYAPSFELANSETDSQQLSRQHSSHSISFWVLVGSLAALLIAAATLGVFRWQTSRVVPPRTVVVLPFENLSNDQENEYLCFGLMDEVTTELAKYEHLRVIARSSSVQFKRGDDIATVVHRLNADAVVEGSISREGNRIRINAQLINGADAIHLWAQTYERQSADPLQVQFEVSRAVASGVAMRLGVPADKNSIRTRFSTSPSANDLYWKGAYFRITRGKEHWRESLEKSADFLEQAVSRDNRFTLAYAALSDVYMNLAFESNGGPVTQDYVARCRNAARRALELDDTSSEAYSSLAVIQAFYDWDWAAAEKNFLRALDTNPNNASARAWYALTLLPERRFDEAIEQSQRALELDPLSFMVNNNLGVAHYLAGQDRQALDCAEQTLGLDPRFAAAYALKGMVLEREGKFDQAIIEYRKGLEISPNHSFLLGRLGHAYASGGHRVEAVTQLREMLANRDQLNLSDTHIAYIQAGLANADALFEELNRAYKRHDPDLPYINADPILDPFRSDQRLQQLLHEMGLPS